MGKLNIVTGGAGFIGSALVRRLLADEPGEVRVVDDLSSGKAENLAEVRNQVDVRRVDIRDYLALKEAFRGADAVFHLAAIPSVPRSIDDPVPSHEVNVDGTFNVYRAAVDCGVRRVIYAASSSAYGDTAVLPKIETMSPQPKSPYAAQKLMGEYYATAFHECFSLETVALRFFNVYGPRQDPSSAYSGVLSKFMTCALNGEPPTIHGDGNQTRDFTYVEDVVALQIKASKASGVSGRVFNAGNGNRYTLNEVWDTLQKIAGVNLRPVYARARPGDVRDSQAEITASVTELGHAPVFTLEAGLRKTLAWYAEDLKTASVIRA